MGRVSRYKRIKAIDPFSKRTHPSLDTSKYDEPPEPGADERMSKRFAARLQFIKAATDAAKGRKARAKDPEVKRQKQRRDELKQMPGETTLKFNERLRAMARQDLAEHLREGKKLPQRKKDYLNQKRLKQKLKKKRGRVGSDDEEVPLVEPEEDDDSDGDGRGRGHGRARPLLLPPQQGKRRRTAGGAASGGAPPVRFGEVADRPPVFDKKMLSKLKREA